MKNISKGFLHGPKKGALHHDLGINRDKTIPVQDLEVNDANPPLLKKRKQFALNARAWRY